MPDMNLSSIHQKFVIHFGEMGARWGMNRTVGQIYAVLFLSTEALCADDLVAALGVSRSNVSMGLKELQAWQLVRLQHRPDDRRDFFSTPSDLWEIVRTLIDQRKAREIDPTLTLLRELQLEPDFEQSDEHTQQRIQQTTDMIELFTKWYDDMRAVDVERLEQLLKLGATAQKVLDIKDKVSKAGRQK